MKCRDVMERIQELLDKGEIKYKASNVNVTTVIHSSSSIKSQDGKEKQGETKERRTKGQIVKIEAMKMLPTSVQEIKKSCLPSQVHKAHVARGTEHRKKKSYLMKRLKPN